MKNCVKNINSRAKTLREKTPTLNRNLLFPVSYIRLIRATFDIIHNLFYIIRKEGIFCLLSLLLLAEFFVKPRLNLLSFTGFR